MVSERVRIELAKIAGRIPDNDADSTEPIITAWSDVVISMGDAEDLCDCIDLPDATVAFIEKHGVEKGERLLKTYLRLLMVPSTVETLQLMAEKEDQS